MGPSDRSKNRGETYVENLGFEPSEHTFVYCRIGERSSHTGGGGIPRPHTDEILLDKNLVELLALVDAAGELSGW
jgi:hypothetical protein